MRTPSKASLAKARTASARQGLKAKSKPSPRRSAPAKAKPAKAKAAKPKATKPKATKATKTALPLPGAQLLAFYRSMTRIRQVEETIVARYGENEMRCPVHLSVGQEAAAVGVCEALAADDKIFSTHRCHSHYLAKGGDLRRMMAEIYGKDAGCIGGRGGSMHLMEVAKGIVASVPIVGSSIALAVGSALADKRAGHNRVTVAFFGDASTEEGIFHESASFAALHSLPVLFVCENNLYSVYTHIAQRQPRRPLSDLAKAHGMQALHGDGNDVAVAYRLTQEAARLARRGRGPSLLVLDTYRWREHCGPNYDNHIGYRTDAEFQKWRRRDPLASLERKLRGAGLLDKTRKEAMFAEFSAEIGEAFDFARAAPLPVPSQAKAHIYA